MGFASVSVELEHSPKYLLTYWVLEISEKNLELFFPNLVFPHDLITEAALGGLSQGVGLLGETLVSSRSGHCLLGPSYLKSGRPQISEAGFKAAITPDRPLPLSASQGNFAPFVST